MVVGRKGEANRLLFVGTNNSCLRLDDFLQQKMERYGVVGRVTVKEEKEDMPCRLPLLGRVDDLVRIARETGVRMVVIDNMVRRQRALVGIMLKSRFSGIAVMTVSDFVEAAAL